MQQEKEAVGSGGGGAWEAVAAAEMRKKQRRRNGSKKKQVIALEEDNDENEGAGDEEENMEVSERQREHPFIVTEPGEVARGKKNGLDYLFHLYEQCREFLIQVQNIAKERGEKCPTKVFFFFFPLYLGDCLSFPCHHQLKHLTLSAVQNMILVVTLILNSLFLNKYHFGLWDFNEL